MHARIVTFRLDDLTTADYLDHAISVAPAFAAWPGLLAKVWIADDETGTYGGIYLFDDRESADRERDTDLFRSMATNSRFTGLSVQEFDVLDEPTAITAPGFAAGHAR
jgi:hypothetical protein